MIYTGIDMIEIDRIRQSAGNSRFLTRVFSPRELEMLKSRTNFMQSAAAGFCAKEAFGKALGTGVSGFKLHEVSLLRDKAGVPVLELSGEAAEIARRRGLCFSVSVTHTKTHACAVVIAFTNVEV